MKAITAIGIGVSIFAIILAILKEGTPPMAFFNIPAYLVGFGGTLARR